jgi:hypothetical protein
MTNVQELDNDKHSKMNSIEFLEFLGRVSEIARLYQTSIFDDVQALEKDGDPYIEGDLAHKLQNLIKKMMICDNIITEKQRVEFIRSK